MNLFSDLAQPAQGHHLALLAPDEGTLPQAFRKAKVDPRQYDAMLGAMQKMRGSIYLNDGAIDRSQIKPDGRHIVASDRKSWHVLSLDSHSRVVGCSRLLEHHRHTSLNDLIVGKAAVAEHPVYGPMFREALRSELEFAKRSKLKFVELGGWAVENGLRFTTEALRIALTTFALTRWLGGCIGVATATVRHCSSRILRKIGGIPLDAGSTAIPSYFDPQYQCEMEVLRFDSRSPAPRFQSWVQMIYNQLAEAAVIWRRRISMVPPATVFEPAVAGYWTAHA
jgi:hypothetical protein